MGRVSSGIRGGMQPNDFNFKGKITGIEPLSNMKDKRLYKETGHAISRFHSVLGVRERNIKLANLSVGTLGVQVSVNGKNEAIYLNKKYFNSGYKTVVSTQKKAYDSGWATHTNKAVAHVVTHELGHALWNSGMTSPKHKAAGVKINKMFDKWVDDKKKKGYGKYAKSNVNEFWAEVVTKTVHGKADKYTKFVKEVVKKYNL